MSRDLRHKLVFSFACFWTVAAALAFIGYRRVRAQRNALSREIAGLKAALRQAEQENELVTVHGGWGRSDGAGEPEKCACTASARNR